MPAVLVYGGCGGLGSVVVKKFKEAGWTVVSVDLRSSADAQHSVEIKGDGSKEDAGKVVEAVKSLNIELDAVICVAGGFLMGNIKDAEVFAGLEKMLSFNVKSAVSASHVAANCLKEGGLLVLTGANAGLSPTPGMIAYGISKAATHHLVKSIAQPDSGMPKDSSVVALLPVMLDTPTNRKDMPTANFDDWTPLETVAETFINWASNKDRPKNGSFIVVKTTNKKTEFESV